MDIVKSPDFYINFKKSQFKTPIEVLKKNFKNLQKLIERNNILVNKHLIKIKGCTKKNEKIKLVDKLIENEKNFQKKVVNRVKQHNEFVSRLVLRIERIDHINELYNKYSALTKKEINQGLPKELQEFYQTENNLLIIEYLLRQFNPDNYSNDLENPAVLLANKMDLTKYIDYDIILQGMKIRNEIVYKKNLKLLKQWCIENKKNLQIIKQSFPDLADSDIEFECDFQEFMELINQGNYSDALLYARKHLTDKDLMNRFEKIKSGSSLIWSKFVLQGFQQEPEIGIDLTESTDDVFQYYSPQNISKPPTEFLNTYKNMISSESWENLGDFFSLNFRLLYGMNQIPPLETMLSIGGSVLKTKSCIHLEENDNVQSKFSQFKNTIPHDNDPNSHIKQYMDNTECPVCSVELNAITDPLPFSLRTKSNIFDDPVMFPNKHVYSYSQLMFFNRENLDEDDVNNKPKNLINGIVSPDGLLDIRNFTKSGLIFPDKTKFQRRIMDPVTGEMFSVESLEKVFPT